MDDYEHEALRLLAMVNRLGVSCLSSLVAALLLLIAGPLWAQGQEPVELDSSGGGVHTTATADEPQPDEAQAADTVPPEANADDETGAPSHVVEKDPTPVEVEVPPKDDTSTDKKESSPAEDGELEIIIEMEPEDQEEDSPPPDDGSFMLGEITVFGQQQDSTVSASKYEVEIGKLHIVPRKNAAEHLMLAPGVLTTNHGGEGHAHETYMRGFAAKEGQDIEYTLNGAPLNEVSNPHGHGYADLLFIPPELVMTVRILEGPFDPEQGDFAFAGSADYQLGVRERGSYLKYGYGRWNAQRTLFLIAPEELDTESFAAFEYYQTDGYGPNRAAKRASALGQYSQEEERLKFKYTFGIYGYMARYDQAGVVREDDYEAGRMGFFDTYDSNQGGESNRVLFTFRTRVGPKKSRFQQVAFLGWRTMRLRTNFTGWLLDDLTDGDGNYVATEQRGDGTEMRYNVLTAGSRGDYTYKPYLLGHEQALSFGYALRFDQGETSQRRLRAVTAIPYKRVFDTSFTILNIAGWTRLHFRPCRWFALKGGVRLDAFSFGVTDHNKPEADREGLRDPSQTSQSLGYAVNPRVTLDFRLHKGLHLLGSYGEGTRSTEAMALSDNETTPFAKAHSAEGGLSYRHGKPGDPFSVSGQASYVYTHITQDMLFSETAGRNIPVGASDRHAGLLGLRFLVGNWFDSLVNVGYAHATLADTGELIPYVPEWIVRLDVAANGQISDWELAGVPITGRVGLGFTYVPGRPLPLKQTGDPMYLLNLGGEIRLYHFSLGIEMRNLLDLRYRQSEYHYASSFESADAIPSQVAERHFVAGEPFFAMGTITWHIEDMIRGFVPGSTGEDGSEDGEM